jgi:peptide-methionine (S)-S-oxide reductase
MSFLVGIGLVVGLLAAAYGFSPNKQEPETPKEEMKGEYVVVGGGCFWCLEPLFEMVKGVTAVEVGYAGGARPNVNYEQVCTGVTGHAESVKIFFDPKVVSRHDLLELFMTMHDPTTMNRQGPDSGPQYRSVIFYETDEQKQLAEKVIQEIAQAKIWNNKIVTTVEPLRNYTTAEDYHQDYYKKYEKASAFEKMQMNSGYCRVVIEPKVRKFREKLQHLMKG